MGLNKLWYGRFGLWSLGCRFHASAGGRVMVNPQPTSAQSPNSTESKIAWNIFAASFLVVPELMGIVE